MINHPGFAGEENRLRIGLCEFDSDPGADNTRCLEQVNIKGIYDQTLSGTQHAVYINSDGQLGKSASSRRYKREIHPIGSGSKRLLDLRPVSFRFKGASADQPVQFGLIAEEVEQTFPELVGRDAQGRADSVRYELLSSLLVNELQRQEREIGMLRHRQSSLRAQVLGLLLMGGIAFVVGRVGRGVYQPLHRH